MMQVITKNDKNNAEGFTLIEVISALILIPVFVAAITMLYIAQAQISANWLHFENAEQLAYNNLHKYSSYVAHQTNSCTDYPLSSQEKILLSQTIPVDGLPSPVSQLIVSSMPYGCDNNLLANGFPIKVVSTVIYGPDSQKMTYATYVNVGG